MDSYLTPVTTRNSCERERVTMELWIQGGCDGVEENTERWMRARIGAWYCWSRKKRLGRSMLCSYQLILMNWMYFVAFTSFRLNLICDVLKHTFLHLYIAKLNLFYWAEFIFVETFLFQSWETELESEIKRSRAWFDVELKYNLQFRVWRDFFFYAGAFKY